MPEPSNYTVLRKLDNRLFAINLLFGTIDELDEDVFFSLMTSDLVGLPLDILAELSERHHIQNDRDQQLHIAAGLLRDASCAQFFIPLTNSCNLACPYCFQGSHVGSTKRISSEAIEAVFSAISDIVDHKRLNKRDCEVVLYGGEPLLPDNMENVESVLQASCRAGIPAAIITNGTTIETFLKLLKAYSDQISNIIVTLDGDQSTHDLRRVSCNGRPTYELICRGIEALRRNNLPCTIRINLDSDLMCRLQCGNINLPEGRREIHRVTGVSDEMTPSLRSLLSLCLSGACSIDDMGENPVIALYSLLNPGSAFSPLLDNCPEDSIYFFSLDGRTICSCNESDGSTLVVGSYRPNLHLESGRNGCRPSAACKSCPVYPVCGGGCRKTTPALLDNGQCKLYAEIIDMIDCYLEYMTGK